jgi:hypothetical protein
MTGARQILLKKTLATVIIALCLGAQTAAIVRESGPRAWPFLSYPMYSDAYREGSVFRIHELRAGACGAEPTLSMVTPRSLHLGKFRYWNMLDTIARDRAGARRLRRDVSRLATAALSPRPCVLQVWELGSMVTRQGMLPSDPQWALVGQWLTAAPDSVRLGARGERPGAP